MKKRPFWIGAAVGMIVAALIGLLLPMTGMISMAATGRMNPVDYMGKAMWESSMFWRAPDETNPFADNASATEKGFESYKLMCVQCHGAPNVKRAQWAQGMFPLPPDLTAPDVQERGDGKLFYITKHGVRGGGMPAFGHDHSDEDVWHIVAFLRKLAAITEEQEAALKKVVQQFEHAHDGHGGGDHDAHEHGGAEHEH